MRSSILLRAVCAAVVMTGGFGAAVDATGAEPAGASQAVAFDIKPQPLASALDAFALQANLQILFTPEIAKDKTTRGVQGALTADAALTQLLAGTGLVSSRSADGMILITLADAKGASASSGPPIAPSGATQDQSQSGPLSQTTPTQRGTNLEEIIVTAQKREERLLDVPVPVTAINAVVLVDSNQLRLQDYYTLFPGLNVMPEASSSFQQLSIRGIMSGLYTNPTVGITVDDVPYGSSTFLGGGGGTVMPDIDPADLARIEVLRGPQGTLYGASSMGGLLKFVTTDPSTDAVSGRIEGGMNSVYNGAEIGYGMRGSVNVPLSDELAIRMSGFSRRDPGYVDNVQTGQRGVNETDVDGGRLSALWRPSDLFSLKVSALLQDSKGYGMPDVDVEPGLGDLQQSELRGTGGYDRKLQAYSANLSAKLGGVDLTAVTGYNVNAFSDSYDLTYFAGPYTQAQFGVTGTPLVENDTTTKFTQELRLSAPIGQNFDWLLGAFYSHEYSDYDFRYLAENSATGAVIGQDLNTNWWVTFSEYAAFADLTYHVTDRFDIQLGGRESHIMETYKEVDTGPFVPLFYGVPSPVVRPEIDSTANAFTYLLTPRFRVSSDFMVYARLASGYRAGGPNAVYAGPGTPPHYDPDKTQSYEIGAKGDFLDRTLTVDASVYYIDWKDIQISLINPQTGITYNANGSQAKSQGVELSIESRPLTGLTIAGWVAWDDAVLTQPFPPTSTTYAVAGDRLPYSSRFSGNVSLEQDFPLSSRVTGFAGAAASYVGDRVGEFTGTTQRQDLPAYTKIDLRAGTKYDSWTVNVFVNNVADKRGVLNGGLGQFPPFGFVYIQPRTIGVSASKAF
jgi:outer membrane receptor protein involved in Fe transport